MNLKKRYSNEIKAAEENGWTVDLSKVTHNGPMFSKDSIHIWRIRDGWQCAQLVNGHYANHKPTTDLVNFLTTHKGGL